MSLEATVEDDHWWCCHDVLWVATGKVRSPTILMLTRMWKTIQGSNLTVAVTHVRNN